MTKSSLREGDTEGGGLQEWETVPVQSRKKAEAETRFTLKTARGKKKGPLPGEGGGEGGGGQFPKGKERGGWEGKGGERQTSGSKK